MINLHGRSHDVWGAAGVSAMTPCNAYPLQGVAEWLFNKDMQPHRDNPRPSGSTVKSWKKISVYKKRFKINLILNFNRLIWFTIHINNIYMLICISNIA